MRLEVFGVVDEEGGVDDGGEGFGGEVAAGWEVSCWREVMWWGEDRDDVTGRGLTSAFFGGLGGSS